MPDVTRSDSQRSDTSLRPRVSFNRDVHVKRIVPREGVRSLGALSGDGNGHLVASSVRKERLKRSKKELADEAAQVLHRVDKLNCVSKPSGVSPEKFYTLPRRRTENPQDNFSSIDRRWARRNKFDAETPPKKPQRTFAATNNKTPPQDSKSSVLDLFKNKPKKSNLRRSVSDASSKERPRGDDAFRNSLSDREDNLNGGLTHNKKQLSPIIEVTQREDYFSENKENDGNNLNEEPVRRAVNGCDDEVDASRSKNGHGVVIIDIDKAKVSGAGGKKNSLLGRKLKSLGKRKKDVDKFEALPPHPPPNRIKGAIGSLQKEPTSKMIHSSQKPVEKLPLTKGRTVDSMVRRLNNDVSPLSPPKPNVMVTPNISVQHNNNQPFSYTRGLSPEKCMSDENLQNSGRPIIYAQVVCQNGRSGPAKQTIHTVYSKKQQHSDSDEGLGNEENLSRNKYKSYTHFGDELKDETPITPKYRVMGSYEDHQVFIDSSARGRADGMDAKRRESLTEDIENNRNDISTRRDMLESRINRRIHSKFNKSGSSSPKEYQYDKSFDSDYRSSPEDKYETSHHTRRYEEKSSSTMQRNVYKSTPDIYRNDDRTTDYNNSYSNNSLRRDHHHRNGVKRNDKDRFGDSGIENDSIRRDTIHKYNGNNHYESEDEGFASSLLIASERQHTEEAQARRFPKKDYDSDRAYSGDDDPYRNVEHMEYKVMRNVHSEYAPRERSIDDGSHFDPRIDSKEFLKERSTLKKNVMKPPKPEKKSSLEKVKQLFSRDTKKKKEKQDMVREESLRARYTEYKGSREHLELPKKSEDSVTGYDYSNRRRLSTPSPSPTREPANDKPDNSYTNWFKSLDRLSRKKSKKEPVITKTVNGDVVHGKPKNLRFFGDTDADSSDGARILSSRNKTKSSNGVSNKRSQSSRELHNITEENNELNKKNNNYHHHKSLINISNSPRKPPVSPNRRSNSREPSRSRIDDKGRRRKYEISSVESSTEGDSSQQSQRSIVYLHAATVGDIPGPGHLRFNGKRASSREELASNDSTGRIQQSKTLSRSFSVLAPWKPRFQHEGTELDYSQYPKPTKNGKFEQRPAKNGISRKENSTLKRKAQERNNGNVTSSSTLSRTSRSKENISKYKDERGSSSTLYKKKDRLPRENSRYNRENRDDKNKMSTKSMSVESLKSSGINGKSKNSSGGMNRDISRSVSMPKDPEKSAGWFKLSNNKNKTHKSDYNMHRL